jgi:enterochelin esterase-like enzyme
MMFVKRLGCVAIAGLGLMLALAGAVLVTQSNAATSVACQETSGALISATVPSQHYGSDVPITIYLPPCYASQQQPLPVIYLLHGANADQTQWPDLRVRPSADAIIAEGHAPFVVVMPGGDYRNNLDYGAFVLDDLLPAIEQHYHVRATGSGRAIGGLSMGGYWALKLAFQHPSMFVAVGGHSPVVSLQQALQQALRQAQGDPLDLARTADGLNRLHIQLDAGMSDDLRFGAAQLADVLVARSVPVSFAVHPGGHNRPYWRSHTEEYLRFYAESFAACMDRSVLRRRW